LRTRVIELVRHATEEQLTRSRRDAGMADATCSASDRRATDILTGNLDGSARTRGRRWSTTGATGPWTS
jgi:hypothetical protein